MEYYPLARSVQTVSHGSQSRGTRRDYWLDFKDITHGTIEYNSEDYRPVTPTWVRKIILDALEMGWSPQSAGKTLLLTLASNDHLEARYR